MPERDERSLVTVLPRSDVRKLGRPSSYASSESFGSRVAGGAGYEVEARHRCAGIPEWSVASVVIGGTCLTEDGSRRAVCLVYILRMAGSIGI